MVLGLYSLGFVMLKYPYWSKIKDDSISHCFYLELIVLLTNNTTKHLVVANVISSSSFVRVRKGS